MTAPTRHGAGAERHAGRGVRRGQLLIAVPAYIANPLRQDLWRAGHAHAGVLLVLSLVALRYVDEARLGERAPKRSPRGRSALSRQSVTLS